MKNNTYTYPFSPAMRGRYEEVLERVIGEGYEILEVGAQTEQNGYPVKQGDILLYRMNCVVAVYPAGYGPELVAALGLDGAEETINRSVIATMALQTANLLGIAV